MTRKGVLDTIRPLLSPLPKSSVRDRDQCPLNQWRMAPVNEQGVREVEGGGGGLSKPTGWPALAVSTNIAAEGAFIALCANRVTAASLHKPPPQDTFLYRLYLCSPFPLKFWLSY